MKSRFITLLLFFCFYAFTITAQTVIKIPFIQSGAFVVQPKVVYKSLEGNAMIEIGSDTEIVGGSGKYSFTWSKNGAVLGTAPVLSITEKGEYMVTINDGVNCEAIATYVIDSNTGIHNIDKADIQIFPNPSSGIFQVQIPDIKDVDKVEIYSIAGKLLSSFPVDHTNTNELRIDASELSPGQYLLVSHFRMKKITKVIVIR